MDRASRQVRSAASKFETREEGNELKIEGYFAVFNSNYQIKRIIIYSDYFFLMIITAAAANTRAAS